MYRERAEHLVKMGEAYPCFCSQERLKSLQLLGQHATGYDGHCRKLSKEKVQEKLQMGSPYIIRLMVGNLNTLLHSVWLEVVWQFEANVTRIWGVQ